MELELIHQFRQWSWNSDIPKINSKKLECGIHWTNSINIHSMSNQYQYHCLILEWNWHPIQSLVIGAAIPTPIRHKVGVPMRFHILFCFGEKSLNKCWNPQKSLAYRGIEADPSILPMELEFGHSNNQFQRFAMWNCELAPPTTGVVSPSCFGYWKNGINHGWMDFFGWSGSPSGLKFARHISTANPGT